MIKACTFINLCKLQFVAKRPISIIYRTYTVGKEMFFTQREMFYWEKNYSKETKSTCVYNDVPKKEGGKKNFIVNSSDYKNIR